MAFDPDAYIQQKIASATRPQTSTQVTGGFDPDAYLQSKQAESMGAGEAFGKTAALSAVPAAVGLAGGGVGLKAGTIAGASIGGAIGGFFGGPAGLVAGGKLGAAAGGFLGSLGGMFLSSYLAGKGQDAVLKRTIGDETYNKLQADITLAREEHPYATFAGEIAPTLPFMGFNAKAVKDAGRFTKILGNMSKTQRVRLLSSEKGMRQLANLQNVFVGTGIDLTTESIQQIREGDFKPIRLLLAGVTGAFLNEPTRAGAKLLGQPYAPYGRMQRQGPKAPDLAFEAKQPPPVTPPSPDAEAGGVPVADPQAVARAQQLLVEGGMASERVFELSPEQLAVALEAQAQVRKLDASKMPESARTGQEALDLQKSAETAEQAARELFPQAQLRLPEQGVEGSVVPVPRTEIKTAPLGGPQLGFGDIGINAPARPEVIPPVEAPVSPDVGQVPIEPPPAGVIPPVEPARAISEPVGDTVLDQIPTVEVKIGDLRLSKDVPQFKRGASLETGVVEGEQLTGKYERTGTPPIVAWRRLDGSLEIITGRHRYDLAKRTGEKTIPVQIVDEAKGFTKEKAATLDAEINIRDEKGEVSDYANYFRTRKITEEEASSRGLLSRDKGKRGFIVGKNAEDDLYDAFQNGKITDKQAVAIASAAPNDANMQRMGLRLALDGKPADVVANMIRIAKMSEQATGQQVKQGDLFGADDTAIKAMEAQAKRAAELQDEVSEQIRAVSGASKRPDIAKRLGVDVKNPTQVEANLKELRALRKRWENWHLDEELTAKVLGKEGRPPDATAIRADAGQVSEARVEPRPSTGEGGADIQQPAPRQPIEAGEEAKAAKPAKVATSKKTKPELSKEKLELTKQIELLKRRKLRELEDIFPDEKPADKNAWRNVLDDDEIETLNAWENRLAEIKEQMPKAPAGKKAEAPASEPKPKSKAKPAEPVEAVDYEAELGKALKLKKQYQEVIDSTGDNIRKAARAGETERAKSLSDYRETIRKDLREVDDNIAELRRKMNIGPAKKAEVEPQVQKLAPKQKPLIDEGEGGFKLSGEKATDYERIAKEKADAEAKKAEFEKKQVTMDFDSQANKDVMDKAAKKKSKGRAAFKEGTFDRNEAQAVEHHKKVSDELNAIKDIGEVKVVRKVSDLPADVREAMANEIRSKNLDVSLEDIAGVYHDGTKYIVTDNIADVVQAKQKLKHELLHERIDKANKDDIELLLGRVYKGQAAGVASELKRLGYKPGSAEYLHELIAMAYEKGVVGRDVSLWNRFVVTMKQLMRKWGVKFDITDTDLSVIANRYLANDVRKGMSMMNLLDVPFGREKLDVRKSTVAKLRFAPKDAGEPHAQSAARIQKSLDFDDAEMRRLADKVDINNWEKFNKAFTDKQFPLVRRLVLSGFSDAREKLKDLRRAPAVSAYFLQKNIKHIQELVPDDFRELYSRYRRMKRVIEIKDKVETFRKLQDPTAEILTKESYADAKNYIDAIEKQYPNQFKKFQQADERWKKIVQDMIRERHANGMISQEAFENLMVLHTDYHPRVVIDYLDPSKNYGGRYQPSLSGLKRLEGSERALLDDWVYAMAQIHQRHYAATAAQKANLELLKTVGEGKSNPLDLLLTKPPDTATNRPYEPITYMENGKQKEFWMPRELADSYLNTPSPVMDKMLEIIKWGSGKRVVQALATGYNPMFAISNIAVDMVHQFLAKDAYSPHAVKAFGQMVKNMASVSKDAWNMTGDAAFLAEMGAMGNTQASLGALGRDAITRDPEALATRMDGRVQKIGEVLQRLGTFSEMLGRTAYMKQAKAKWMKAGKSATEARLLAAREAMAIIDYNQAGTWVKLFDAGLPYLNANVQAATGIAKAAKRDPKMFAYKASQLIAFGMAYGMANRAFRSKEIDSIPDRERVDSIIMPIGVNFKDKIGNDRHLYAKIKLDPAARIFKQLGEELAEAVMGGNPSSERLKMAHEDLVVLAKLDQVIPPTMKAAIAYFLNKDVWRNEDIWKGAKVKEFAEYTSYTPEQWKLLGKMTGASPERSKRAFEQVVIPHNIFSAMWNMGYDALVPNSDQALNKDVASYVLRMPFVNKVFRVTRPVELTDRQKKEAQELKIDTKKTPPLLVAKKIEEAQIESNTDKAMRNAEVDTWVRKLKNKEVKENDFRKWLNTIPRDDRSRVIRRFREKMAIGRR